MSSNVVWVFGITLVAGIFPTDKRFAELADMWAFTLANMGVPGPEKKP